MRPLSRSSSFVFACVTLLLASLSSAAAQSYSLLQTFSGPPEVQFVQQAVPLALGRDGNLYGQSQLGGTSDAGALWSISPGGAVNVIYSFTGSVSSATHGGLTLGLDGNFYGASGFGGTYNTGFLFKITPAGVLTNLHSLNDNTEGGYPQNPPTLGPDGNLYGFTSTEMCCQAHFYKLTPAGVFKALGGVVSIGPGPLLLASDGNFYGVSARGGTAGFGTVFKVTPSGKLSTLHSFTGPDGESPFNMLVQGSDGFLYGTTPETSSSISLGTIFKISTAGAFTKLHTLAADGHEGTNMFAGLIATTDGNFYGVTNNGGDSSPGSGTVFQITPAGAFTVVHNFNNTVDLNNAWDPISQGPDGTLFGAARDGGTGNGGVYTLSGTGLKPLVIVQNYSSQSGQTINILGTGFTGATAVNFGTIAASKFTVVSDSFATAVVPPTAITSVVSVTTPGGIVSARGNLKVTPRVTDFTPTSGPVGTSVTLTGAGFTGATHVTFGGVKATMFTVNSATRITATVPTAAKTGAIGVTTVGGSGSKGTFTVN